MSNQEERIAALKAAIGHTDAAPNQRLLDFAQSLHAQRPYGAVEDAISAVAGRPIVHQLLEQGSQTKLWEMLEAAVEDSVFRQTTRTNAR